MKTAPPHHQMTLRPKPRITGLPLRPNLSSTKSCNSPNLPSFHSPITGRVKKPTASSSGQKHVVGQQFKPNARVLKHLANPIVWDEKEASRRALVLEVLENPHVWDGDDAPERPLVFEILANPQVWNRGESSQLTPEEIWPTVMTVQLEPAADADKPVPPRKIKLKDTREPGRRISVVRWDRSKGGFVSVSVFTAAIRFYSKDYSLYQYQSFSGSRQWLIVPLTDVQEFNEKFLGGHH